MEDTTVTPEAECLVCHSHFAAALSACPRCGTGTRLRSLDFLERLLTGQGEEAEEPQEAAQPGTEKEAEAAKKSGFLKRGKR
jgi:hypothetical protein